MKKMNNKRKAFEKLIQKCRKCDSMRDEVDFNSMPAKAQEMNKIFLADKPKFYYCKNCDEYSFISPSVSF